MKDNTLLNNIAKLEKELENLTIRLHGLTVDLVMYATAANAANIRTRQDGKKLLQQR